jgi:beta-apo-4'-carotenal oxygenase
MSKLPPFEHTPIESIPGIVNGVRATFLSHKTRPLEYRVAQLRKLYWA